MLNNFELFVAIRYFRGKKDKFISLVSYLSMIGIMLGVAILIIVMSVMNGYEVELIDRILGINGHLSVSNTESNVKNYEQLVDEVKKIKGVQYAAPILIGQALAVSEGNSLGVMIRGMNEKDLEVKPIMKTAIEEGNIKNFDNSNEIIIGISLAEQLGVNIGDTIKLIAPKATSTIAGLIPRMKAFKIAAIFDVGMYEYNSSTVFMPLDKAQVFLECYNSVSEIEVILSDPSMLETIKSNIHHQISYDFVIRDWGMVNH